MTENSWQYRRPKQQVVVLCSPGSFHRRQSNAQADVSLKCFPDSSQCLDWSWEWHATWAPQFESKNIQEFESFPNDVVLSRCLHPNFPLAAVLRLPAFSFGAFACMGSLGDQILATRYNRYLSGCSGRSDFAENAIQKNLTWPCCGIFR